MYFHINKESKLEIILAQIEKYLLNFSNDKNFNTQVITISSEIIYNIVKFSQLGEFEIIFENNKVFMKASDNGNGFANNVEDVFEEGYSTAGSLGLGLPSIVRLCDNLEITTSINGTHIKCEKEK